MRNRSNRYWKGPLIDAVVNSLQLVVNTNRDFEYELQVLLAGGESASPRSNEILWCRVVERLARASIHSIRLIMARPPAGEEPIEFQPIRCITIPIRPFLLL